MFKKTLWYRFWPYLARCQYPVLPKGLTFFWDDPEDARQCAAHQFGGWMLSFKQERRLNLVRTNSDAGRAILQLYGPDYNELNFWWIRDAMRSEPVREALLSQGFDGLAVVFFGRNFRPCEPVFLLRGRDMACVHDAVWHEGKWSDNNWELPDDAGDPWLTLRDDSPRPWRDKKTVRAWWRSPEVQAMKMHRTVFGTDWH